MCTSNLKGKLPFFSEERTPERYALFLKGDKCILRIVKSTAIFEASNRAALRKPSFMFGDASPTGWRRSMDFQD